MKGGISKMTYVTALRGVGLPPAEYLVLMTVWTYSDERMLNAFPSMGRLSADTGLSRSTVKRCLRSLRAEGYLTVDAKGGNVDGKNMATRYRLTLPQGGGVTHDPPGVHERSPGGVTHDPLSDPSPDHESDPPDTGDSGESTQSSYTVDPDGSALTIGERNDPISPAFHHSQDRRFLLRGVQAIAQNRTDGDEEKLGQNLDNLLLALNTFFGRSDEYLWGSDYGWEDIPKKCVDPYEAGKWLNTYLNSWQQEEGDLEWTPHFSEEISA